MPLLAISREFGKSVDWLLTGEEKRKSEVGSPYGRKAGTAFENLEKGKTAPNQTLNRRNELHSTSSKVAQAAEATAVSWSRG